MPQEIYLDNSATTRVSKAAAEKALYMMTECYGNPSSLHSKGFAAEREMTAAREILAQRLSAQPGHSPVGHAVSYDNDMFHVQSVLVRYWQCS